MFFEADADEAASELIRRSEIRGSLLAWCRYALGQPPHELTPARHHRFMIRELEALTRGETDRLMLFLPPGSAKSTYATKLFPPWFLSQAAGLRVICASASSHRAEAFSLDSLRFIRGAEPLLGYSLLRENVKHWMTSNDGEYVTAGAGSQITGVRADLMILDDVVAGREDADSIIARDKVWAWYQGDVLFRMKPRGRIILIMTRWHEDDLAGRILRSPGGDRWRVIRLPAVAEPNDPLGRAPGEALWPEWEGLPFLEKKRRESSEREWNAQFQQRPTTDEGAILKRAWWQPYTEAPPDRPEFTLLSLDPAYTEKEQNDRSACTVWQLLAPEPMVRPGAYFDPQSFRPRMLLRYAWAERLTFPDLIVHLLETAEHFHRDGVPMRLLVEAKASGLSIIQELRRRAPKLAVFQVTPHKDKVARANSVTSLFEGERVYAMARKDKDDPDSVKPRFRPWAEVVIAECAAFPRGEHDDYTDSVTQALRHFRDLGVEFFKEDEAPPPDPDPEPLY